MSIAYSNVTTLPREGSLRRGQRQLETGIFRSLVVSPHRRRLRMFERAAAIAGWEPTLCRTAQEAIAYLERFRWQLLILDLDPGAEGTALEGGREVLDRIGLRASPLVMVCGREGDALEEIWARQLGVWLYLPGVDEDCDIAELCSEALKTADKLSGNREAVPS